uniref:Uncharacterized protein n=1 Tax=Anguilla anguilla TaxID=7936 RepID=A0A0E9UWZ4_ANGAN
MVVLPDLETSQNLTTYTAGSAIVIWSHTMGRRNGSQTEGGSDANSLKN